MNQLKLVSTFLWCFLSFQLFACRSDNTAKPANQSVEPADSSTDSTSDPMKLKLTIGSRVFTATLSNNATATAFKARLPLTLSMVELNGNEKYANLSGSLPTNAANPGTIQNGDLMLYGSNTFVLFYKTFSTSYSYTRIGRIDNPAELAAAVGSGTISITFEAEH